MTTRFRSVLAVARLALITVAMTACGTASGYLTPSESTTTLMLGWEQRFTLAWSVGPEPGGADRVRGYVTNEYGSPAEFLRLLAQALDPSGAVVGQRIAWVPGALVDLGAHISRSLNCPAADHYRVSVWDFSFVESASL